MTFPRRQFLSLVAGAAAMPMVSRLANAQAYPVKPITIIVPFAAGGPGDALARIMAGHMKETLGQSVVIENVTGAGGSIGVGRAVRAAPDGYTVSFGHLGTHVANRTIYALPYDPLTDLEPVVLLPSTPMIVVSKPAVPARTLTDLIGWLKHDDVMATSGTAGNGSASHIAGLYLQSLTGVRLQFVPYGGTAPALNDLIAGQIDLIVDQASNVVQQIRAGRIRAYAVTDTQRLSAEPEIPTTDEAGLPGFHMTVWSALWVPKGTPANIIATLNAAAVHAMADPQARRRFNDLGLTAPSPDRQTPQALAAWHRAEAAKWDPIVKAASTRRD
jgi:tripartite-type tricarboxylate transporter receptor subunit TctC